MRENKPGSGESHRSLGALELIHETSIPFAKDDVSNTVSILQERKLRCEFIHP